MNILTLIVFLPTLGALACLVVPKRYVRGVAVAACLATFLVSLLLFRTFFGGAADSEAVFGSSYGTLQEVFRTPWITSEKLAIEYFVGIDGLGFPLVILTTLVGLLACLASWNFETWKIAKGIRGYFVLFLLLETGMLGVFVSLDFFLFYIFWEVMLLPMYFLIGVWGGPRREYAAIKFFLFTLAGSVLMLVALVVMYFYSDAAIQSAGPDGAPSAYRAAEGFVVQHGTFDLIELATNPTIQNYFASSSTTFLGLRFAPVMFMFLFIGFAIKLPSVPVHTWLPDCPRGGSDPHQYDPCGRAAEDGWLRLPAVVLSDIPDRGRFLGVLPRDCRSGEHYLWSPLRHGADGLQEAGCVQLGLAHGLRIARPGRDDRGRIPRGDVPDDRSRD